MFTDSSPLALTIGSDFRLLPIVRHFLESICEVAGLDRATANAIVLATHEAATNVIRHAHRDHPDARIHIECRLSAAEVEVRILDEGAPFNLEAVPNLDPAELRLGGRGVFLMRKLMDELDCGPRGERGNTLRMVKHRKREPAPGVYRMAQ